GRTAAPERTGIIVAISGRNQLRGYVDEVRVEGLLAQVRLRIGDQMLTAIITRDAVDELKLRRGEEALAIVKSTEVMIARETETPPTAPRTTAARRKGRRARARPVVTRSSCACRPSPPRTDTHHCATAE